MTSTKLSHIVTSKLSHIEVKSHREINDEHVLCQDVLNVGSSKFV